MERRWRGVGEKPEEEIELRILTSSSATPKFYFNQSPTPPHASLHKARLSQPTHQPRLLTTITSTLFDYLDPFIAIADQLLTSKLSSSGPIL